MHRTSVWRLEEDGEISQRILSAVPMMLPLTTAEARRKEFHVVQADVDYAVQASGSHLRVDLRATFLLKLFKILSGPQHRLTDNLTHRNASTSASERTRIVILEGIEAGPPRATSPFCQGATNVDITCGASWHGFAGVTAMTTGPLPSGVGIGSGDARIQLL